MVETLLVPELNERIRLSDFVPENSVYIKSRKAMKKAILKDRVRVNGTEGFTHTFLKGGETLQIEAPKSNKPTVDIPLEVVYEDDYIVIVNKPAGLPVSGNGKRTLENAVPPHSKPSKLKDALERPQPLHRLDQPTTGLVMFGLINAVPP